MLNPIKGSPANAGEPFNFEASAYLLATYFFIAVAPLFSTYSSLSRYDIKRGLLIATICLLATIALKGPKEIVAAFKKVDLCLLLLITIVGFISACRSQDPLAATTETSILFLIASSAVCLSKCALKVNETTAEDVYPVLLTLLSLPIALYVIGALAITASSFVNSLPMTFPEPIHSFINVRFFNQFQSWALPLLISTIALRPPFGIPAPAWRLSTFTISALFWALLWHSNGRGVLLAIVGATVFVAVFARRPGRQFAIINLAASAVGAALAFVVFDSAALGLGTTKYGSFESSGRIELWRAAWQMFVENSWLGAGPMHFAALNHPIAAHPHNALLQFLAEWGAPATALILAWLTILGWRWFRFLRKTTLKEESYPLSSKSIWITSLSVSMLAPAAHSMVSGIVVTPHSQMMMVLTFGCAVATYRAHHANSLPTRTPALALTALFSALVLTASGIVLFALYKDFPRVLAFRTDPLQEISGKVRPRYWHQGIIIPDDSE